MRETYPEATACDDAAARENPARIYFSTHELPPEEQFSAWHAANSAMVDVTLPDRDEHLGYRAEMEAYNLGKLIVSSEKFDALKYELTPAKLRRSGVDHWLLGFYKTGSSVCRVGDDVVETCPGKLSVRSLTRPFVGEVSVVEMVFAYLPRDYYPELASSLDEKSGVPLAGGMISLLSEYLLLLERQLPSLKPDDYPRVAQATEAMIASCLAPSHDTVAKARAEIAATIVERAKRYIRRNIRSKTLSPDELSIELGVSRTTLYRLFEPYGGVAREIRLQRLIAGHSALIDNNDGRRICEVADSLGFSSADEFGRAFKRQFGYTPREARYLQEESLLPCASVEPGEFGIWIRDLGRPS